MKSMENVGRKMKDIGISLKVKAKEKMTTKKRNLVLKTGTQELSYNGITEH